MSRVFDHAPETVAITISLKKDNGVLGLQVSSPARDNNNICLPPVALLHIPRAPDKPWRVSSSFPLPLSLPTVNLLLRLQSGDYFRQPVGVFFDKGLDLGCGHTFQPFFFAQPVWRAPLHRCNTV